MKKNKQDRRPGNPEPLSKRRFTRPVILSLILHSLLLILLAINFKSFLPQNPTNYSVTLTPLGSSGEGTGGGGVPAPPAVEQTVPPVETPKPESKKPEPEKKPQPSKDQKPDKVLIKKDTIEGLKKSEKTKKAEPVKDSAYSYKDTQEKILKMSKEVEGRHTEGGQTGQGASGLASGTPGTGGGTAVNAYLAAVQAKVTQEWVLPESLSMTDNNLETTVGFFIDRAGKAQKLRFIKKSGSDLYDQAAMRAIKKAEPFSPVPISLIDEEIGLNFNQRSGIGRGERP
jgi:outer membrane biosynthesis protein TonB